jgi:hypothetical protein
MQNKWHQRNYLSAGQEEIKNDISAFQGKVSPSQAKFEERMVDALEKQLESVTTEVEQQAQQLGANSVIICKWRGKTYLERLGHYKARLWDPAGSSGCQNKVHW